jgi:hypothetical protein
MEECSIILVPGELMTGVGFLRFGFAGMRYEKPCISHLLYNTQAELMLWTSFREHTTPAFDEFCVCKYPSRAHQTLLCA